MSKRSARRKPEQIVKLLQEGEAMLAVGKSLGEVYQKLGTTEASWMTSGRIPRTIASFLSAMLYGAPGEKYI